MTDRLTLFDNMTDRLTLFGKTESDAQYEKRLYRMSRQGTVGASGEDVIDILEFDPDGEKNILVVSRSPRYAVACSRELIHRGLLNAKGKSVFALAGDVRKHVAGFRFDLLVIMDEGLAVDNAAWERLKPDAEIAKWTRDGWKILKHTNQPIEPKPAPAKPKSWILKNVAVGDDGKLNIECDGPPGMKVEDIHKAIDNLTGFGLEIKFAPSVAREPPTLEKDGYEVTAHGDIMDDVLAPPATPTNAQPKWPFDILHGVERFFNKPLLINGDLPQLPPDTVFPSRWLGEGDRLAAFFATSERDRMAEVDKQIRDNAGLDKNGWPKIAEPESDREIVDRATATIVNVVRAGDSRTAAAMKADVNATIAAIHAREREAEARAATLASIRDDFDNLPDAD